MATKLTIQTPGEPGHGPDDGLALVLAQVGERAGMFSDREAASLEVALKDQRSREALEGRNLPIADNHLAALIEIKSAMNGVVIPQNMEVPSRVAQVDPKELPDPNIRQV